MVGTEVPPQVTWNIILNYVQLNTFPSNFVDLEISKIQQMLTFNTWIRFKTKENSFKFFKFNIFKPIYLSCLQESMFKLNLLKDMYEYSF